MPTLNVLVQCQNGCGLVSSCVDGPQSSLWLVLTFPAASHCLDGQEHVWSGVGVGRVDDRQHAHLEWPVCSHSGTPLMAVM